MLEQAFKVIEALNKYDVDYTIIGGYAVVLHGYLRATEDIDILVKMTKKNISNLQRALLSLDEDDDIYEINFDELENYSVIRYGTNDDFYLDIISRIGELFDFQNIESQTKIVNGVKINFATASALLKMKQNTYREKDKLDILFLKEKIDNDKKV